MFSVRTPASEIFRRLIQYCEDASVSVITALNHLGWVSTSFSHLHLGNLTHSSRQILWSTICWMGSVWTVIIRFLQMFMSQFKFGWATQRQSETCYEAALASLVGLGGCVVIIGDAPIVNRCNYYNYNAPPLSIMKKMNCVEDLQQTIFNHTVEVINRKHCRFFLWKITVSKGH